MDLSGAKSQDDGEMENGDSWAAVHTRLEGKYMKFKHQWSDIKGRFQTEKQKQKKLFPVIKRSHAAGHKDVPEFPPGVVCDRDRLRKSR